MNKKILRLPALSVFAAAAALSVASTTWAGQDDSCKAAKARIAANAASWKDGGACDISDEDKAAVKPNRYGTALTQFRSIKDTFMANFDKSSADSLGAGLNSLRAASENFIKQHPERGEMNEKLKDLNTKIANLNKAVDAMRPSSMTNAGTLRAIDHAMGSLQDTCDDQHGSQDYCPGSGTGALETLDALFQKEPGTAADPALATIKEKVHALNDDGTGLGDAANILVRMRRIYNCRASDEQLSKDLACHNAPATVPEEAPGAPKLPLILVSADTPAPTSGSNPFILMGSTPVDKDLAAAAAAYFNKGSASKPDSDPFQILRNQGWHIPAAGSASAPDSHN